MRESEQKQPAVAPEAPGRRRCPGASWKRGQDNVRTDDRPLRLGAEHRMREDLSEVCGREGRGGGENTQGASTGGGGAGPDPGVRLRQLKAPAGELPPHRG